MTKRKQENLKWEGVIRSPSLDYNFDGYMHYGSAAVNWFSQSFYSKWAKVVRGNSRWARVVRDNSRWARVVTATGDGPGLSLQQKMGQGCPLQQQMGQDFSLQQNYCGNQVTAGEPQCMWIHCDIG